MKLRDLEARLVKIEPAPGYYFGIVFKRVDTVAEADGVDFRCPRPECGHHVRVYFQGRGVPSDLKPTPRWTATGRTLDDLSLSPSIHLNPSAPPPPSGEPDVCRWHGYVTNGEAS